MSHLAYVVHNFIQIQPGGATTATASNTSTHIEYASFFYINNSRDYIQPVVLLYILATKIAILPPSITKLLEKDVSGLGLGRVHTRIAITIFIARMRAIIQLQNAT